MTTTTDSDEPTTDGDTDRATAAIDPEPYDHLRPTDADVNPGVYRVVGTGDPVALLRVGDAGGYRVTTGRVVTVDRSALSGFEPAANPDGNRSVAERVAGGLGDLVWQVRAFGRGLRARPVISIVAVALVVAGNFGADRLPGPEVVSTVALVAGALTLAYVGSRNG